MTEISKQNDEKGCSSPFLSVCVCTINVCNEGCAGCEQWEKHSGTDCREMLFCCLPFTILIDTVSLFVTIPKWIYTKCSNTNTPTNTQAST